MANFTIKPAQVFAAINASTEKPDRLRPTEPKNVVPKIDTNVDFAAPHLEWTASRREIRVTATGRLSVAPDRCRFSITVSSRKESIQDVKNSVSRRKDYVLQTLRNSQVRVSSSRCFLCNCDSVNVDLTFVWRFDNNNAPDNCLKRCTDHVSFQCSATYETPI